MFQLTTQGFKVYQIVSTSRKEIEPYQINVLRQFSCNDTN